MILALVLLPGLAGLAVLLLSRRGQREVLLLATAALHPVIAVCAPGSSAAPVDPSAWLALDAPGRLVLLVTSLLFLAAAVYAVGYLRREPASARSDFVEGVPFSNEPERVFVACLLFFLASMTLVTVSQHLGLLWIAIEATTLASAPLIYFHRHHRSLEATWKYLLVCSVGIAIALLGNLLLAAAVPDGVPLQLDALVKAAPEMRRPWLEAGFVLLLVGYGTKMGLVPMHTWLPDAHSESPSLVSALLSGALLNCAFLGILRGYTVISAAGAQEFAAGPLAVFGLLSMSFGALAIARQPDYKRLLAFSSVEHMGILSLAIAVGGEAVFGAMLHLVAHGFTKAALFLTSGNLLARYGTKQCQGVRHLLSTAPVSGVLWIAGTLAIVGSPPFGPFLSEFTILRAMLDDGRFVLAVGFVLILAIAFIGMVGAFLPMAYGRARAPQARETEPIAAWLPPALLLMLSLVLGLHLPSDLRSLLHAAAEALP